MCHTYFVMFIMAIILLSLTTYYLFGDECKQYDDYCRVSLLFKGVRTVVKSICLIQQADAISKADKVNHTEDSRILSTYL